MDFLTFNLICINFVLTKLYVMKQMNSNIILLLFIFLGSCINPVNKNRHIQHEIDSLKTALNNTYKPGFGELMSSIQMHHAKLWFAGSNGNWPLADVEINEIIEALDDIQTYCSDRPEFKEITMIYPAIDSLKRSIKQNNILQFQRNFRQMTNVCNKCHSITSHAFNVITVPEKLPVVNQDFQVH